MSAWPDWLKVIQLKPRFLFGLWFLGAMILAMPTRLATQLGVDAIRDSFRAWIGVATLAALSFWIVQLTPSLQAWWKYCKRRSEALGNLESLSSREREILAYCLRRNQRTVDIPLEDPAARSLQSKGLLEAVAGYGNATEWPWTVPTWAWKHLKTHGLPPASIAQEQHDS
jgi:hypothetical protein